MWRARTILQVAKFELLESLKSMKALVLLLLFLLGAFGASALFVNALDGIQSQLSEQLGQKVDMKMIMENPNMIRLVEQLVGDREVAKSVVTIPPLAIFYGATTLTFAPLLVLFTSSDAISSDVASGAVRFSLFRIERISWAAGKLLGQTFLMTVAVLLGAAGCLAAGLLWLDGMDIANTAWWLLRVSGSCAVYTFAYLGVAMCASQLVRTNARARALALAMMFMCSVVGGVLQAPPIAKRAPELLGALSKLLPNGHSLALWHPGLVERGTAMLALIAIGLAFFGLGFLRFHRRDA